MGKIVVGILAHVDAGKTTLSEGMLYTSGAIRTMGRVDNRDAFLDTYALERERGITIFSKQAVFSLGTTQVTLLDTPGHVDFSPEMERTLQVLDYAILVISGADGVQGHTRTLWNLFRRYEIPTFVFVNKMDQEGTDTYRFTEAGARISAIYSDTQSSVNRKGKVTAEDMIAACGNVDVLILEGLKDSAYPKVEVVRRAVSEHKVCATEHLIAVATDVVTQDAVNCPVYDMNDIAGIYACILGYFGISGRLR